MNRKLSIGFSVIVAAIIANYAILADTHAEQDNCSFGPVSNADYRAHLARAKALLPTPLPSLLLDDQSFALKLKNLFENLSRDESNIYSRLAIMHATLRAAGAEYRNTNGNDNTAGSSDPYAHAATSSPVVSFNYTLDINRLWIFRPWPRDAWVIGSLAGPRYTRPPGPQYPKKTGGIGFIVWGPSLLEKRPGSTLTSDGVCPPIPGAYLADKFVPET